MRAPCSAPSSSPRSRPQRSPAAATEVGEVARPEPATEQGGAHNFDVERIASGLNRPVWVGAAPGDPGALWVLEQPGRVVRIEGGAADDAARHLRARSSPAPSRGCSASRSTPTSPPTGACSCTGRTAAATPASPSSARARICARSTPGPCAQLLYVDQPEENHNGGQLAFGPDGRLYLGPRRRRRRVRPAPDRPGPEEPARQADRRRRRPTTVPRWSVVLTGLRNPWRFWFDPALGEVWIGDVGQDEVEEVDRVLLELDEPPKNLGWSAYEGTDRIGGHDAGSPGGDLVWPVAPVPRTATAAAARSPAASSTAARGCRASSGATSTATSAPGTLWSLRGTPKGARRGRAARAGRRSRSSRTSAPTPTASSCSPPAAATSTARSRPPA